MTLIERITDARSLLRDADLDAQERGKLRRRIEDCLRKNPGILVEVAAMMTANDWIRIDDLI